MLVNIATQLVWQQEERGMKARYKNFFFAHSVVASTKKNFFNENFKFNLYMTLFLSFISPSLHLVPVDSCEHVQCYIFNSNVNALVTTAATVTVMCEFRWNDNEVDVGILCTKGGKGGGGGFA